MYTLVYTKSALNDTKKLDVVVRKRIKKKIELYSNNPIKYASKLVHSSLGMYRWRIGSYRIVFDMKENQIIILRIGHRREIYR